MATERTSGLSTSDGGRLFYSPGPSGIKECFTLLLIIQKNNIIKSVLYGIKLTGQ